MDGTTLYPDPVGEEFVKLYRDAVVSYVRRDLDATTDRITRLLGTSGIGLFTAAVSWGTGILSACGITGRMIHAGTPSVDDVISAWARSVEEEDFTQTDAAILSAFLSACTDGGFEGLMTVWNSAASVHDMTGLVSALLDMYVTLRLGMAEYASRN